MDYNDRDGAGEDAPQDEFRDEDSFEHDEDLSEAPPRSSPQQFNDDESADDDAAYDEATFDHEEAPFAAHQASRAPAPILQPSAALPKPTAIEAPTSVFSWKMILSTLGALALVLGGLWFVFGLWLAGGNSLFARFADDRNHGHLEIQDLAGMIEATKESQVLSDSGQEVIAEFFEGYAENNGKPPESMPPEFYPFNLSSLAFYGTRAKRLAFLKDAWQESDDKAESAKNEEASTVLLLEFERAEEAEAFAKGVNEPDTDEEASEAEAAKPKAAHAKTVVAGGKYVLHGPSFRVDELEDDIAREGASGALADLDDFKAIESFYGPKSVTYYLRGKSISENMYKSLSKKKEKDKPTERSPSMDPLVQVFATGTLPIGFLTPDDVGAAFISLGEKESRIGVQIKAETPELKRLLVDCDQSILKHFPESSAWITKLGLNLQEAFAIRDESQASGGPLAKFFNRFDEAFEIGVEDEDDKKEKQVAAVRKFLSHTTNTLAFGSLLLDEEIVGDIVVIGVIDIEKARTAIEEINSFDKTTYIERGIEGNLCYIGSDSVMILRDGALVTIEPERRMHRDESAPSDEGDKNWSGEQLATIVKRYLELLEKGNITEAAGFERALADGVKADGAYFMAANPARAIEFKDPALGKPIADYSHIPMTENQLRIFKDVSAEVVKAERQASFVKSDFWWGADLVQDDDIFSIRANIGAGDVHALMGLDQAVEKMQHLQALKALDRDAVQRALAGFIKQYFGRRVVFSQGFAEQVDQESRELLGVLHWRIRDKAPVMVFEVYNYETKSWSTYCAAPMSR